MISAIFLFDNKGDVLMYKLYRQGVKRNIADVFKIQVISQDFTKSSDVRSPILTLGSTSFIYTKQDSIWFVAVTRSNQDVATILEFLNKFYELLKSIVQSKDSRNGQLLTRESIVNNFTTVYELLDETVEFGYPVNLESSYLKNNLSCYPSKDTGFKFSTNLKSNSVFSLSNNSQVNVSNISWRQQGLKYRRNEIFLNVDEKVNVVLNHNSEISSCHIDGIIMMKTHLSGMPECRFGFTNNCILLNSGNHHANPGDVILEHSKFHQCVQLNKFDSHRIIQFVPPDGEFQLMSYQCKQNVNLPFKIIPQISIGNDKVSYKIKIKSYFPEKLVATNVQIKIPTPKGVIHHEFSNSGGKCKFLPQDNTILWKFNKFNGNREYILTADVSMTASVNDQTSLNWTRPPIKLDFVLDMFSCSGLTVKFLKVTEKSSYRTVKWVKYQSQSGSYEFRY